MFPDYVINLLDEIAKDEGFVDYKVEPTNGSKYGNYFVGSTNPITLSGNCLKNGQLQFEKLHLMVKVPPRGGEVRQKTFWSGLIFRREVFIYSHVFPTFVEFQKEKGLSEADSFLAFPKIYSHELNDENQINVIIMEDLGVKNYEMWPVTEKLIDLEHELHIMKELGKFHGVSFALKDQRPHEYEDFKQITNLYVNVLVKSTIKGFIRQVTIRAIDALENPKHKKVMRDFLDNYMQRVDKLKRGIFSDDYGVIAHGDCCYYNILFQHSNDTKKQLKATSFVDFQYTHCSPPIIDILFNIFTFTDKPFRDQHYETLLKTYHSSLSDMIRKLGSDPNELYSYETFQMQMRKYVDYVLVMAPIQIAVRVAKGDVYDIDEYARCLERGEEPDYVKFEQEETKAKFASQMNGLIADLVKYGYLKCE